MGGSSSSIHMAFHLVIEDDLPYLKSTDYGLLSNLQNVFAVAPRLVVE